MYKFLEVSDIEQSQLNAVLKKSSSGEPLEMHKQCPICAYEPYSLHIYFHSRGSNRIGGVWVWCNHCFHYLHGTIKPPQWWINLDSVKPEYLESAPYYLEALVNEIDTHWLIINSCRFNVLSLKEDTVLIPMPIKKVSTQLSLVN